MSYRSINRSGEMEVFIQVVEMGSFSRAALSCGMSQSAVSKLISRLEARLETRLFNRSTRRLDLTAEGCVFYERARTILADMKDAEHETRRGSVIAGRIRLTTSASYAVHVLEPILSEFLDHHRHIEIDIVLTDNIVDMLAERTDVAIRAGSLKDSRLVALSLGDTPMQIVASPEYLERNGEPQTIEELDKHCRIGFGYPRENDGWHFPNENKERSFLPLTRVVASDGETVRRLALQGMGLARLAGFSVRNDIAERRLIPVLSNYCAAERESFHVIHIGHGGHLPARVRALIDFLANRGRIE